MDTTLEPNTKSGMPSPLRSATSTKSASGVFGSDPGLGQPTPATAAPNDRSQWALPFLPPLSRFQSACNPPRLRFPQLRRLSQMAQQFRSLSAAMRSKHCRHTSWYRRTRPYSCDCRSPGETRKWLCQNSSVARWQECECPCNMPPWHRRNSPGPVSLPWFPPRQ